MERRYGLKLDKEAPTRIHLAGMAFVAKLPTRDMYLQEGQYGSKLHLRLNPNTHCCDGTYEPASLDLADIEADLPNAVDLEGERSPGGAAPGHAVLFGQVKPDPESGLLE